MNDAEYRTPDMNLAAYLYSLGMPIIGTDWVHRRCFFTFRLCSEVKDAVSLWQSGQATVNALAYADALKTIKGKLYRHN